MSSQVPLYSLSTPSQYPVIALVDSNGNPANLTGYIPAATYEPYDPDRLIAGEATMSRRAIVAQTIATGNQSLRLTYFTARKTETVTQVRLVSGTTAAGATPTLVRVGVYSVAGNGDLTLIASIANDTTLLAASSTGYTRALTAPFSKVAGQRYAVGTLVVTATTAPTLMGNGFVSSEAGMPPKMGALVAAQADLPATITAATAVDSGQLHYTVLLP